jgi:serine kinase of HPr protein (carbohydrate metabolism regulator)
MTLTALIEKLGCEVKTSGADLSTEVTGVYVSDLLSDVMANAKEGNLWITLQIHHNIVAVAVLKDLSGIILVNNRQPEEETLKNAEQEKIPILVSTLSAFVLAGKLYESFGEG